MPSGTPAKPTHYQTLGISPDADAREIREAYRALAKRLHPDVDSRPGAESRFAAVVEAYEVLIEQERRHAYDEQLRRARAAVGATVPHYSWDNIAAARPGDPHADRVSRSADFDRLYDMFFGGSSEAADR